MKSEWRQREREKDRERERENICMPQTWVKVKWFLKCPKEQLTQIFPPIFFSRMKRHKKYKSTTKITKVKLLSLPQKYFFDVQSVFI